MITVRSCARTAVDPKRLVQELLKRVKASPTELSLLASALGSIEGLQGSPDDLEETVFSSILNAQSYQELKNWIFQEKKKIIARLQHEWITSDPSTSASWKYLEKAQSSWERRMLRSLNSMCQELGIRLAGKRDPKQSEAILQNWSELSLVFNKPTTIKPVFGPKDLLEVLISIRHPNVMYPSTIHGDDINNKTFPYWGLFNLPLKIKDLPALSDFYGSLEISYPQYGIDELFSSSFALSREQEAEDILRSNSSLAAQVYLQRGCPLGYRAQMWALYLNSKVTDADVAYYNQLKMRVAENECMTDHLICKEVQLTASNDDMHFVFCDYTYQILLPFTRDSTVLEHFKSIPASPPRAVGKGSTEPSIFPPSGVIPFHGFSMYVLPLCYLYDNPVMLYVIFRQLYLRHFYKLHTISNDASGILAICSLFERLLMTREPQVFLHLKSYGIQPIRFVFKWIMRAFSGFLSPDQVLMLWDRILGFDSLEILAVLAVAIFSYRRSNLLLVNTSAGVEAVLADLTSLRVVSLLQLVLFSKS
ncbi:unnamed protein product [Calicophoron daubneyi]|uniref:Rab-GAP TBC domain-containing protein n=1 Tax=Calicophoron daubneyi TaxID=300641 RepID=A0AAV2TNM0_CALDB